jgi:hypothetical protein
MLSEERGINQSYGKRKFTYSFVSFLLITLQISYYPLWLTLNSGVFNSLSYPK